MADTRSKTASTGCIAVAGVLGLLMTIGMCSSPKDKTAQSFASPSLGNQIETMAPPTPTPIAPVSGASLRKSRQHLAATMQAEGLSGAMIYSQNCYDALSRAFSWAKLDQCGGFDMLAVKAADAADAEGLSTEVEYFGPEAAAGRYLAVATKAGEEAEDADKRLEALQRRAAELRAPASGAKPTPKVEAAPEVEEAPDADVGAPAENGVEGQVDV